MLTEQGDALLYQAHLERGKEYRRAVLDQLRAAARVDISERVNIIRGPGNLPAAMGIRLPPGMRSNPADESNGRGNL